MATTQETPAKVRQSRVGKRPVVVPAGVTATIKPGFVSFKGAKGTMERAIPAGLDIKQEGSNIQIMPLAELGESAPRIQGLVRALLRNMADGVSKGYTKALDLYGTGYRAEVAGQNLTMALGFSHQVKLTLPTGIKGRVEIIDEGGTKRPRLHLESHDKELLGQVAAKIRSFRPPEPYKGKGVRYVGEHVRQKAGKAGGKGKK